MFAADMPNVPPSTTSIVMVAEAGSGQQAIAERGHVLGICQVLDLNKSSQRDLFPTMYANGYFDARDAKIDRATAVIAVLEQPKHGRLESTHADGDWSFSRYLPEDGYLGHDSFVMRVAGNGRKVELHYFVFVTDDFVTEFNPDPVCKGVQWKMSSSSSVPLNTAAFKPPQIGDWPK